MITLGSPQHGTALAALGSLLAGECPIGLPAADLDQPDCWPSSTPAPEVPAGPAFVSFWTSHDQVVLPPESAELTGALNIEIQSVCPASAVDHTGLPTDPLVARMVAAELAGAAVVPLGAGRLRPTAAARAQLVMSLVVKFAQAAPRKTTT